MATITMDTSEYEVLMDKMNLLEKSLEREKELQDKISELKDENIKALENSKMKVVKITKTEHTEHLLQIRPDQYTYSKIRALFGFTGTESVCPAHMFDFYALEKLLFSRCKSVSYPLETITTHGLDEVKEELRKELDDEIKQKLEIADQKTKEYSKINNELTETKMELSKTKKQLDNEIEYNKKAADTITNQSKTAEQLLKMYSNVLDTYNEIFADKVNVFNCMGKLKKLRNSLNIDEK